MPVTYVPDLRHDPAVAASPMASQAFIARLIARRKRGDEPEAEPVRSPRPKPLLGGAAARP